MAGGRYCPAGEQNAPPFTIDAKDVLDGYSESPTSPPALGDDDLCRAVLVISVPAVDHSDLVTVRCVDVEVKHFIELVSWEHRVEQHGCEW